MPAFIPRRPRPAPGGKWGSFASIIAQDDQAMIERARESVESLGGATFRPALMEKYKNQDGETHETTYEEVAGNRKSADDTSADTVAAEAVAPEAVEPIETVEIVKAEVDESKAVVAELQKPVTEKPSAVVAEEKEPATEQSSAVIAEVEQPSVRATEKSSAVDAEVQQPSVQITESKPAVRQHPEITKPEAKKALPVRSKAVPAVPMKLDPSWLPRVEVKAKAKNTSCAAEPCKKTLNKRRKRASKEHKRLRKARN